MDGLPKKPDDLQLPAQRAAMLPDTPAHPGKSTCDPFTRSKEPR
jgi:hypothetical protein